MILNVFILMNNSKQDRVALKLWDSPTLTCLTDFDVTGNANALFEDATGIASS